MPAGGGNGGMPTGGEPEAPAGGKGGNGSEPGAPGGGMPPATGEAPGGGKGRLGMLGGMPRPRGAELLVLDRCWWW